MTQLRTQYVCQVCGRTSPSEARGIEHWLHEPHRSIPGVHVTRCPMHWSEWALRNSTAGRTTVMRERMRVAHQQPVPVIPAWLDPFPMTDKT